jgi:hypothetical protein
MRAYAANADELARITAGGPPVGAHDLHNPSIAREA